MFISFLDSLRDLSLFFFNIISFITSFSLTKSFLLLRVFTIIFSFLGLYRILN